MKTKELTLTLGDQAYPIIIGRDVLGRLPDLIADSGTQGAVGIVSDSNVAPLYAGLVEDQVKKSGRPCSTHVIPAGEDHKRLSEIEGICGSFLQAGLDRSSLIVALGGGVPGDMAGFAAASFMRGIPFLQIPTTIVAQVDSSVGGKTGVNHPLGKNTIGAFHQPKGVLIDMAFLQTLPDRELRSGMAEVIKHGVIADADLFAYLEQHVGAILGKDLDALVYPVLRSCEIKAAVVAEDEKEHGIRANLNYGHTFGHAIESVSGYTRFLHGEAVALGMVAAAHMARNLAMVDDSFLGRQRTCCAAYGLPTAWPELPVASALEAMQKDKKVRAGTMKFILALEMGRVVQRTDIAQAQAQAALESVRTSE